MENNVKNLDKVIKYLEENGNKKFKSNAKTEKELKEINKVLAKINFSDLNISNMKIKVLD